MSLFVPGWRPDLPDHRDHVFSLTAPIVTPSFFDLRPSTPPVFQQGSVGSCTGQSTAAAIQFDRMRQFVKSPQWTPSRLFLYYNGRVPEGTAKMDVGASIRDVVKGAVKLGAPSETLWPYVESKVLNKPVVKAYREALKHTVSSYASVPQNLSSLRQTLASGFPVVFGFTVYPSFETPEVSRTGVMVMPGDESALGGHAVLAVGYDDSRRVFIVRNSWGERWGDKGHFYMPYDYILNPNLAADFWVIQAVSA